MRRQHLGGMPLVVNSGEELKSVFELPTPAYLSTSGSKTQHLDGVRFAR